MRQQRTDTSIKDLFLRLRTRFRPLTQYQEQNKMTRWPISLTIRIIQATSGTRDVDLNESVIGESLYWHSSQNPSIPQHSKHFHMNYGIYREINWHQVLIFSRLSKIKVNYISV